METIYDFVVETNRGVTYKLDAYKGDIMLVVNIASECGFTSQLKGLQPLYEKYKDRGFVILGFPYNQFGGQEPSSSEEAVQNYKPNYGVTFPMHQRVDIKEERQLPLFRYLTAIQHEFFNEKIKWNFTKFLMDREGNVARRFAPRKKPAQIEREIERSLQNILTHNK